MNDRVYIHELIDVIGHHRARYLQHMTANWSPIGQEERGQLCYGVWALLGSTGAWPKTVNMWEHTGWSGLAASFETEAVGGGAQDPALARWWAAAAEFRSGGYDRIVVPAPWTRTIEQLCADGVHGDVYAHELVTVAPGTATRPARAGAGRDRAARAARVGALRRVHHRDGQRRRGPAVVGDPDLAGVGRRRGRPRDDRLAAGLGARTWDRVLMVDSPLNPMRTGRQPARSDRVDWTD